MLSSLTVGRVDFGASLNKDRTFSNSEEMYNYCSEIYKKAKLKNLKTTLGGAISIESKNFIEKLVKDNLIEKYETRKLVYKSSSINSIEEGLKKGVNFELLWLKSKRRYYHRIRNEDEKRIEMLEKRLNNS